MNEEIFFKNRKLNLDLYPSKWIEYNEKYDKDKAIYEYYRFCRGFSLEKCILKYGEEQGTIDYNKKSLVNRGTSLEKMIDKYGEEEGTIKYNKWKLSIAQNKENFIKRYGEEQGLIEWKLFCKKNKENLSKCIRTDSSFNSSQKYRKIFLLLFCEFYSHFILKVK